MSTERATVLHGPDGPYLSMPCPKYGTCYPAPPLKLGQAENGPPRRWGWNGSEDAPTITPSVGCDNKCGAHRIITNGVWKS